MTLTIDFIERVRIAIAIKNRQNLQEIFKRLNYGKKKSSLKCALAFLLRYKIITKERDRKTNLVYVYSVKKEFK